MQIQKGARDQARRFLFHTSLPIGNSVKIGLRKTSERLSAFGYRDFSDKKLFLPATYLLNKPGKMLRPALVFLGANILEEDVEDFVDLAVAAEVLHTASLAHDDIIDKDTKRRGMPSLHIKYDEETAIITGDALIAKAVALSARYGPEVVRSVANAALDMCAGELLDYSFQKEEKLPSVREYINIARLKSGTFLGTCFNVAAIASRNKLAKNMFNFGLNLGIAFQIRDDIIEVIDLEERKRNGNGSKSGTTSSSIVRVFEEKFKISRHEAIEKAVSLNNYFVDRSVGFIIDQKIRSKLNPYVDFVRIRKG